MSLCWYVGFPFFSFLACFTEDKPSGYMAPYDWCVAFMAVAPNYCDFDTTIRNRCCYHCQQVGRMLGESKYKHVHVLYNIHIHTCIWHIWRGTRQRLF